MPRARPGPGQQASRFFPSADRRGGCVYVWREEGRVLYPVALYGWPHSWYRSGKAWGAWDATSISSCLLSLYILCLLHLSPSFLLPRLSSLLALPFP